MTDTPQCVWTCTRCEAQRGRAAEWVDDFHPAGSRVMYCRACDSPEWHRPPVDHIERYPGDPYDEETSA